MVFRANYRPKRFAKWLLVILGTCIFLHIVRTPVSPRDRRSSLGTQAQLSQVSDIAVVIAMQPPEHRTARAIDWQWQSRTARAMIARCATWSWIRPHAVSWTRMRRRSGRRRRCARATARLTRTGQYQSCPWWSWHVIPRTLCIAWSLRHPAASPPNQFFEAWNCVNLQASHRPEYLGRVLKSIHDASKNSNHRRPCVFVLDLQTKNPANAGGIGNAAEKGSRGIHYDAQQVRCS